MASTRGLYRTRTTLERTLRVSYPAGHGRIVLRTEQDWEKDVDPVSVSDDGNTSTFRVQADQPFLYFKPCLVHDIRRAFEDARLAASRSSRSVFIVVQYLGAVHVECAEGRLQSQEARCLVSGGGDRVQR